MNEQIHTHLAALNTAWQRYARTAEEQVDPNVADALNRDYLTAWEGLDACGVAEWMLAYDPETLTFSLATPGESVNDAFATLSMPAVSSQPARSRWHVGDLNAEQSQLV